MEENKEIIAKENKTAKRFTLLGFLLDMLRGIGIGVAFIIPGFSGGSVAAVLGIYEKIIGAISGALRKFKESFITLLPIAIGMGIGAVSFLFPLEWALGEIPFQTVSMFVGLTLGCLPSLAAQVKGKIKLTNVIAFLLPMILTVLLSFAPMGSDVDLYSLNFGGYLLLFLIGFVGSSALVIPGISGSMILLMLGYYNPIVKMITGLIKSIGHIANGEEYEIADITTPVFVIAAVALGIAVGFVTVSVIMKKLLEKCKRGTYFAILGFIVGSLPTIYVSTYKDCGFTPDTLPRSVGYWAMCALALAIGVAISLIIVRLSKKKNPENQ